VTRLARGRDAPRAAAIAGAAAGVAIAVLAAASGCKAPAEEPEEAPPVTVRCVPLEARAVDETVSLRGRLEPPPGGDLPVASQVAGRVVQVAVHEGQKIKKGDLVASVVDAPSRDALRQAEASLVQAKAAEVNAAATLERAKALVARGIAAKQELDDAVARADAARGGVTSAQASLDLARRTLGRVQVVSSFDGVVTRIWRGPGALVDGTAGTPILQLAAAGAVEFVADAIDRELAQLEEGQAAHGELSIGGVPFDAKVRARATALDPATGLGAVRLSLDDPNVAAPIGAFGRVVVTTRRRAGVLVLPASALRGAIADGAEVAVCDKGKARLAKIEVGFRGDAVVEVTSGLGKDDRVAVDHVLGLDDGTAIVEAK